MGRLELKSNQAQARKRRVRSNIHGTATKPRLTVTVSGKNFYAQLIDDDKGVTIASSSSIKDTASKTITEKAQKVAEAIAVAATKAKIETAVLDRSSKRYHGRIKAFAETANEKGLKV